MRKYWLADERSVGVFCLSMAAFVCMAPFLLPRLQLVPIWLLTVSAVLAGGIVGWKILPLFLSVGIVNIRSVLLAGLGGIVATAFAMPLGAIILGVINPIVMHQFRPDYILLWVFLSLFFAPVAVPCGLVGGVVAQFIFGSQSNASEAESTSA